MFGSGSPRVSIRRSPPTDYDRSTTERALKAPHVRSQPRVSVVIPALNEARNLPLVLPHIPRDIHEVILVDGASVDGTIEVARSLLPSIRVVHEPRRGKGTALCAGFEAAEGDIIVMLDADGSTDPTEIPCFVDALVRGADFAKGSRFLPDGGSTDISRLRAFGNWGFVTLVRLLFGGRYTDLCYGYNAFWASVLPLLALDGTGFEIETMMNVRALRLGLRVSEVPSFERSRVHGVSNLRTFRDGWRVLRTIVRERLTRSRSFTTFDRRPEAAEAAAATVGDGLTGNLVPVMDTFATGQLQLIFDGPVFTASERSASRRRVGDAPHLVPVMGNFATSDAELAPGGRAVPTPGGDPSFVPAGEAAPARLVPVIDIVRAGLQLASDGPAPALETETSLAYAVPAE